MAESTEPSTGIVDGPRTTTARSNTLQRNFITNGRAPAAPLHADPQIIHRTLTLLHEPGSVVELRVLETERSGTVSGYFDDLGQLAEVAAVWSGKAPGVYTTLNPCKPELLARSNNRVKLRAKLTTSDRDIVQHRWFPIDFDPMRPAGISATAAEHTAALARAQECRDWLLSFGSLDRDASIARGSDQAVAWRAGICAQPLSLECRPYE